MAEQNGAAELPAAVGAIGDSAAPRDSRGNLSKPTLDVSPQTPLSTPSAQPRDSRGNLSKPTLDVSPPDTPFYTQRPAQRQPRQPQQTYTRCESPRHPFLHPAPSPETAAATSANLHSM